MKTKCKQVFKIIIALILAVLMIVGTTATGFASIKNNLTQTGANSHFSLLGDFNNWSTSSGMVSVNKAYGGDSKYYAYLEIKKDSNVYFALWNGSSRYAPSDNNHGINSSSGGGTAGYNSGNCWKYTGSSKLIKVCIDEANGNDEWYPYVWVEDVTISISNVASTASKKGGETLTITPTTSGGAGTRNLTYTCTQGTTDVSSTVLSKTSGSSTTFTAPQVSSATEYKLTATVTDGTYSSLKASKTCTITVNPQTYSVTYSAGSTGGTVTTLAQTKTYGVPLTLASDGASKANYELIGWTTTNGGTEVEYELGETYTANQALTLYPVFRLLEVNYDWSASASGFGTVAPSSGTIKAGNSVSITATPVEGYYVSDVDVENASTTWTSGNNITFTPTADGATCTVTFSPVPYKVNFNSNKPSNASGDISGAMQDQSFTYDAEQALSANGFTLPGWHFGSWNTQTDGKGTKYTNQQVVSNLAAEKDAVVKLYAQWTQNRYFIRFNKNNDSAQGTMENQECSRYEETYTLNSNAYSLDGYHFTGWNTQADGKGTAYADGASVSKLTTASGGTFDLYAQWAPNTSNVTVKDSSGNTLATASWTYGIDTVIDSFSIENTKYVNSITYSILGTLQFKKLEQKLTIPAYFTILPYDNIEITAEVLDKNIFEEVGADNIKESGKVNDGYIPGIEVGITYTAKSGTAITDAKLYTDASCTTLYTGSELTLSGNTSEYTLVGTMPASDIYVKFETESSCSLYYEGYVYNPKVLSEPAFTSDIATITATYGDNDIPVTSPVNVVEGNCVKLTVSNINSGYTFQGWVQGSPKGSVLAKPESGEAYTIYPSGDTKLYAIFTKDVYLAYSSSSSGTYTKYQNKMNFDVSTATYVDSINFENTSKYIKIYDENNNNDATSNATIGTSIGVTFDMYNTKTSYAYCKISGLSSGYADPISVFLNVSNRSKPVINAKASVASPKVFLSSGRLTINNAIGAVSAFTDGLGSPSSTDDEDAKIVKKKGETSTTVERYVSATLDGAQSVSVQTQIQSADYTVEAFVVYDATKSKAYALSGSEIKNLGNNTFGATVDVTGNTYICPVFVNSESYYSSHTDVTKVKLYVDTASIANLSSYQWGPLVAGYVWGNEATVGNFGEWPGQLLVPDKTGEKFYCYINKKGSTTITGITLNNYCTKAEDNPEILQGTAVGCESVLNNGLTELQTYDYDEPICLQKDGYDEITFVAKENLDGYHGNATYPEGRTGDRLPSDGIASHATSTSMITSYPFKFDYLKYRNGVSNMSLTGNKLEGEDDPLFYIVAAEYAYNDGKEDHWPVKWYIYDENKKYVLNCDSSDLYDKANPNDTNTKLITSLLGKGYTLQKLTDSPVMITYERTNMSKAKSVYRFDGQWYGSKSTDEITLTTKVGLIDANNNYIVSNSNIEYYGKSAFLSGELELSTITVEKSDSVTLNATPLSYEGVSYRFVGYYTRNASGMLNQVSTSATYTPVLQDDETYYAFFKEIGTGSFSVNLKPYTYQAESAISSHLGTSSLNVSIYNYTNGEKGTLINSGDLSTQGSYAEIAYEENKDYFVEITSDPSGEDNFFAWYTDSVDAQGNSTYEEILTDESQVGSKDKVTSSFIWSYNAENPTSINIYADVQKVSVDVTYQFQYIGRNGSVATFTISSDKNNKGASVIDPDLALTSEQLSGQDPENGFQKYYPKYMTRFVLNDDRIVYGYAEYLQALKDGKTMKSESNFATAMIEKFKIDVHGNTVSWSDEDNNIKYFIPMDSRLTVIARQVVPTYTLKASYYTGGKFVQDVTTYADQPYNTLASFDLESIDAEKDGKPFAYWKNAKTDEFITYVRNYGRRITENIEIEAVYGEKLSAWLPKIDTLQLTRELSDTSDYTYADFTLNYLSQDGKVLKDQTDSSYGLILVRKNIVVDPDKDIDKDAKKITDATIESKSSDVRTSVNSGDLLTQTINKGASTAFDSSGTIISKPTAATDSLCYFFDLTSKLDLTSYNRANYMMGFNNKSSSYINFYFVAYAWVKIGSEIHIYEAGSKNLCMYNTANGL